MSFHRINIYAIISYRDTQVAFVVGTFHVSSSTNMPHHEVESVAAHDNVLVKSIKILGSITVEVVLFKSWKRFFNRTAMHVSLNI